MPALEPTDFYGTITWIGFVADRVADLSSCSVPEAELSWEGIVGEAHGGNTRPACSRVRAQHPKGCEIRNVRQLSVLSVEELRAVAADMGLEGFDPAWAGASLVLEGIPDLSHLPPSSRLQAPSGATLVIDMENRPCHLPAPIIDRAAPGLGKRFKTAATARRGVTGWVERPGLIRVGEKMRLHIPDQPVWTCQTN